MIRRSNGRRRNQSTKAWKHQVGEEKSKRFPLGLGLKSHGREGSLGQGKQGLECSLRLRVRLVGRKGPKITEQGHGIRGDAHSGQERAHRAKALDWLGGYPASKGGD